ncbi:MAG: sodium:solute symporter family protein [Bacteriovoracaceae bacterium]
MTNEWVFILLYLVFQVLISVYLTKFIKNESDFFLGGRNVPVFALAFSIFATWFGAETCIGSSGAVFSEGMSGSKAEPLGYGLCLFLMALFIAPRLWNEKYTTLGDFFKERFGTSTEKIAIWILVPSSVIWAAAQIRAFGQVIATTSPLDVEMGIVIATVFVIGYTFLGGLLGDIVTDVLQGVILSVSLLLVFIFTVSHLGGVGQALSKIPVEKLSLVSAEESIWERIDSWLIPIFGSLIAQELIARILAAKDKKAAVKSSSWGTVLYLIFGSIPVFLGLIGNQFGFELQDREQFLPTLAKTVLPTFLYLVFAGALISAILSTIDSILLAISALLSHNLIVPVFKIESAEKKLLCARLVIVATGVISYFLAVNSESVYEMVETASSFGTTGILIVTLMGLFTKFGDSVVANVVLILGIIFSLTLEYYQVTAPFLTAIVLGLVVYVSLGVMRKRAVVISS